MITFSTAQEFQDFILDFEGELIIRQNKAYHSGNLVAILKTKQDGTQI